MKYIGYLIIILALSSSIFGTEQGGKDIPLFNIGLGARPAGMGNAYTAVANDCHAVYWNPAGMLFAKPLELGTMQAKLSTDLNVYYLSGVFQNKPKGSALPQSAWGIFWINGGLSDIPLVTGNETEVTDNIDVKPYDYAQYSGNAIGIGYAWWLTPTMAGGITVSGIYQDLSKISQGRGLGFTITPGILWLLDSRLALGVVIRNLVNYQKWSTGTIDYSIPELGTSISWSATDTLLISSEIRQKLDSKYKATINLGGELNLWNTVRLRAGFDEDHFTAGCGLYIAKLSVNYAFTANTADGVGDTHRVSMEIGF